MRAAAHLSTQPGRTHPTHQAPAPHQTHLKLLLLLLGLILSIHPTLTVLLGTSDLQQQQQRRRQVR
jgi:hypothetical protein